ncbi:BrnT family toxin [Pinirhizobacter sp.]|jgi:hypothetical protein|uniref:BrnT family toxin n=1 Tax=Pinirhizobacter sp. TaxID=2950432 RepID=UPI002F41D59F
MDDVEFDRAKDRLNKLRHGVEFADAEQVLRDPYALTIEDPDAVEEVRCVTLGMDSRCRLLVVVHTSRGKRSRIISARKASRGESRTYHA